MVIQFPKVQDYPEVEVEHWSQEYETCALVHDVDFVKHIFNLSKEKQ